ncbi:MAG: NusG domain II-containing protein [Clostridia bacterium]|nr:NusG domain II-containing protein [Clostridia bacterium]
MKKGDVVIFVSIIALAIISAVCLFIFNGNAGSTVVVKQNNKIVYEGSLGKDKVIGLKGNRIVIEKNSVYMEQADCANQSCVKTGIIKKAGESIVCLPNKVTAEIK